MGDGAVAAPRMGLIFFCALPAGPARSNAVLLRVQPHLLSPCRHLSQGRAAAAADDADHGACPELAHARGAEELGAVERRQRRGAAGLDEDAVVIWGSRKTRCMRVTAGACVAGRRGGKIKKDNTAAGRDGAGLHLPAKRHSAAIHSLSGMVTLCVGRSRAMWRTPAATVYAGLVHSWGRGRDPNHTAVRSSGQARFPRKHSHAPLPCRSEAACLPWHPAWWPGW